MEGKLKICCTW